MVVASHGNVMERNQLDTLGDTRILLEVDNRIFWENVLVVNKRVSCCVLKSKGALSPLELFSFLLCTNDAYETTPSAEIAELED